MWYMKSRFIINDDPAIGTEPVPDESGLTAYQLRWKEAFLSRLETCYKAKEGLGKTVGKLVESGIQPRTIIAWGVEAGYSHSWVKTVVYSTLMRVKPHRPGIGGRRTPPEAIEIAERVMRKYHEQAPKYLLAAYRYAKKQVKKGKNGEAKEKPAVHTARRANTALAVAA